MVFIHLRRLVLPVAALLLCAACASRPENVFLASEPAAISTAKVDMLVATTRNASAVPGEMFGGDRSSAGFGEIVISIPPGHKPGAVEWPKKIPADPATSFATLSAETISRDEAKARFAKRLARGPSRNVLVFVHGYNNRFDDAVFRFAQIVHDSGTDAIPVLFTWPSRGELLAYGYDRDSATYSRSALEHLLQYLVDDKSVDEISVLAHSMGNWVTLETLRQIAIRDDGIPPKIRNVMLADADVDIDIFRTQVAEMGKKRPAFTVFVSKDDKALAVSKVLWGSNARLGEIDPDAPQYREFLAENRIDVVNMTDIKTDDRINHGKFAESPDIIRLIGKQLATGQPLTDANPKVNPISSVGLATASAITTLTGSGPVGQ
ncbi:alpha/beta hydrolase [Ancylobacter oerskovii]|uniref:Alpha/beta hydrolase n=1 Tax=Ancylobacter oerskovii TaxID=459519 RepID=A0ABW4YWT4_9HYPH|nr:alpha/beta hydrolase [Ancylobacter oerskovii]MBS7544091.1 alpha/beta hydrolase [Ancylobacter oerskovii]